MTEAPRNWRLKETMYNLTGCECGNCGSHMVHKRAVCLQCNAPLAIEGEEVVYSGGGEVYSHTTLYSGPDGFESQTPYVIALVKLDEGPFILAQLTDVESDEVTIGMPLEMVTRKLRTDGDEGVIFYGYKFRPPVKESENSR